MRLLGFLFGVLLLACSSVFAQVSTSPGGLSYSPGGLNAAGTAGNLVIVGPGSTQFQDASQGSGTPAVLIPGTTQFTSNLAFSGTTIPTWLSTNGHTISGTSTATSGANAGLGPSPLSFFIGSDTAVMSTAGIMVGMAVVDAPAAGFTGFRTALAGYVAAVGSVGSGNPNLVGVLGQVRTNSNQGGSTFSSYAAGSNQSGSLFAMNANVFAQSGATFLVNIVSEEFDVSLPTGSSSAEKHGITIVKSGSDAVQGNFDDSALQFNDQDATTVGWNFGISFGAYAHKWSFTSSSTLIGIQNRVVPSAGTSPANIGVDMTNGTFTTAQFKGTGFLVDPNGVIINSGMATGTPAASVCLDASNHLIKKTTTGSCI